MTSLENNVENKILVVGGGRMGAAIINGWLAKGIAPESIFLIDQNQSVLDSYKEQGVNTFINVENVPISESFSVFLLALKPQIILKSINEFNRLINLNSCLISVAAGITVSTLRSLMPNAQHVVRVMPNTPAMIGKGVLVGYIEEQKSAFIDLIEGLFSSLGKFYWVTNEEHMHSVTAISGSGPAYAFYFTQCFIESAKKLGLPEPLAQHLALETIIGSSALLDQSDEDVMQLRENVTSPNGTTQAGLETLMSDNIFMNQLLACCEAAKERSIQLS
ncbi:pyrroline-5-carboxylate reductase [Marinomonas sp. 2405UD68-3]|uniref:pyrroline-5-carboxylate reductase n=1 Tax=Marinomonas sp. 2405UD68-3 TaxID=3391835 RepID=UPI0039C93D43